MIPIEQIAIHLEEILMYLQQSYSERDGFEMTERITKLNAYLAMSAELMSDAKYWLDKKKGEESERLVMDDRYNKLQATQLKNLLDGKVSTENRIYIQCERVNRTITHQIDALRSQLSFLKSLPE